MGVGARRAATNTYRIARNLQGRLNEIQGWRDPDLTAAAQQQAREDRRAAAITAAATRVEAMVKSAAEDRDFAQSRLAAHRPQVDLENVAQLNRTAQTWDMIVKPMRAAGRNWTEIAAAADTETLAALSRFAPQTVRMEDPADADAILANLQSAVDQRLAQVHPDGPVRELFIEAQVAQEALDATVSMSAALHGASTVAKVTEALILGQRRLHPMGLLPTEPPLEVSDQARLSALAQTKGIGAASASLGEVDSAFDIAMTALPGD